MAFTNVDAYAAAIRDWLLIHGGRPRVERRAVTDHDEASLLSPAVLKAQEAGAGGEGRPPAPCGLAAWQNPSLSRLPAYAGIASTGPRGP
jgi:hypothetical protein